MDIVYISSDSYMKCTAVSIQSLYENNIDVEVLNIYVLSDDITAESRKGLIQVAQNFNRTLEIKNVSDMLKNFAKSLNLPLFRGSYAVYASLCISQIFPDLEKVLLLDADTLINDSLVGLWSSSTGGLPIAAVPEVGLYSGISSSEDEEVLYGSQLYFNSGVILYDLKEWRKQKVDLVIRDVVDSHGKPFYIVDQSILNVALKNKICRLHLRYNYYSAVHAVGYRRLVRTFAKNPVFEQTEFDQSRRLPCVIHFVGCDFERPWYRRGFSVYKNTYLQVLARTPWATLPLQEFSSKKSIIYFVYDEISLILQRLKLHDFYHWYRYIFGQRIKRLLRSAR